MEKIEIAVTDGTKEIIVRQGEALELHDKQPIVLAGNINAVSEFVKHRKDLFKKEEAHVIFNEDKETIILVFDETSHIKNSITAKLERFTDLEEMKINKDKMYGVKELLKMLKFKKFLFAEVGTHAEIVNKLMNFTASVNSQIENKNDQKGNRRELFEMKAKTDLELSFVLAASIFKGFDDKKFRVEIMFDITDGDIKFWLESVELEEIIQAEKHRIFSEKKEELKDYVIIEQ